MDGKYDVVRSHDGALVIRGVDREIARSEAARLNAEAKVINPETRKPTGMFLGLLTSYVVCDEAGRQL